MPGCCSTACLLHGAIRLAVLCRLLLLLLLLLLASLLLLSEGGLLLPFLLGGRGGRA